MTIRRLFVLATLAYSAASGTAHAGTIAFEAIDVGDTVQGEDLWTYRYLLAGEPLEADQGFAIFFDHALYSSLAASSAPAGWDVLVLQPDAALPSDGIFDALSLAPGLSPATFDMSFVWLGGDATPGAQAYEVYGFDTEGSYTVLSSATTVPRPPVSVPDGGSLLPVLSVLLGAAAACRARLRGLAPRAFRVERR